jgi:hypothetical protein
LHRTNNCCRNVIQNTAAEGKGKEKERAHSIVSFDGDNNAENEVLGLMTALAQDNVSLDPKLFVETGNLEHDELMVCDFCH